MPVPITSKVTLPEAVNQLRGNIPAGFPISNTDEGSVWNVLLNITAQAFVDSRSYLSDISLQAFVLTATGGYLDAHAQGLNLLRIEADFTEGNVDFTATANGSIPAGAIVQTLPDIYGKTLRYKVLSNSSVVIGVNPVRVKAESTGTAYNVGANRVQTLVTSLAFISSVTNTVSWVQKAGIDVETDDLLRERCLLQWQNLSSGGIYKNYVLWGREVPGITKVSVDDNLPRGQGTVNVYVAPSSGLPTTQQLSQADAIAQARKPITANVQVLSPTVVPTAATVTIYRKITNTETLAVWTSRVQAVFDLLSIGETFYPSKIVEALEANVDVIGVTLGSTTRVVASASQLITAGTLTVTLV